MQPAAPGIFAAARQASSGSFAGDSHFAAIPSKLACFAETLARVSLGVDIGHGCHRSVWTAAPCTFTLIPLRASPDRTIGPIVSNDNVGATVIDVREDGTALVGKEIKRARALFVSVVSQFLDPQRFGAHEARSIRS